MQVALTNEIVQVPSNGPEFAGISISATRRPFVMCPLFRLACVRSRLARLVGGFECGQPLLLGCLRCLPRQAHLIQQLPQLFSPLQLLQSLLLCKPLRLGRILVALGTFAFFCQGCSRALRSSSSRLISACLAAS